MTYSYPTLICVCDFAEIRPQMAEKLGFKDTYKWLIMVVCSQSCWETVHSLGTFPMCLWSNCTRWVICRTGTYTLPKKSPAVLEYYVG